jgi:membrane-bound lytic murein transglycosylase F
VPGEIKYTVTDYNVASINKTYYPILNVETPVSFSQRIAWAVRNNSPKLLASINSWVTKIRKDDLYYILYNKYFKNKKTYKRRVKSEFYSRTSGKISPYDSLLKVYADTLNWDWRLLASLVYQESKFDPRAQSWAGALGLMQMMPSTAREVGVSNAFSPTDNLKGGSQYLRNIWEKFDNISDSTQRVKFTMASYNCGYGHVLDAQRLAKKYGADKLVYDDNVEVYLRKMSSPKYYNDKIVRYGYVRGEEPYQYVRKIFLRYFHYTKLLQKVQDSIAEKKK